MRLLPPLILHLSIAREVVRDKPELADLQRYTGTFYLGSTAPDIRLLTGAAREATHFFDLAHPTGNSGQKALFQAYPHLAPGSGLDGASKTFVAGYLSHLITDELWVMQVYQPYFGTEAAEDSRGLVQVWDRALQYELDLRERDPQVMATIRQVIQDDPTVPGIPFISPEDYGRWRQFIVGATQREPSWERFSQYAQRFLVTQGKVSEEAVATFLADFATMRQRIVDYVPAPVLARFRQESVERSIAAAQEYLE